MTSPRTIRVSELINMIQNHHGSHEADGRDALNSVKSGQSNVISMINGSGARLPLGSVVILDQAATTDNTFTTSTTIDDPRVFGITLQDAPTGGFALVAVGGRADKARVATGTVRGQYLRQSSTAGVLEGTSTATGGTIAYALSTRDSGGYSSILFLDLNTGNGTFESISSAAASTLVTFWDDFSGLSGIVTNYRYLVAGPGSQTFAADATSGRTRMRLDSALATAGQINDFSLSATFTPRAAGDWIFKCVAAIVTQPIGGTEDFIIGFRANLTTGTQDGIYFRVTNGGNLFLVCRSGGTESTVDLGATTAGTKMLLEFRITSSGTSVQAYLDGVATGSAITTNIPTGLQRIVAAIDCRADTVTTDGVLDIFGWGWKGNMVG